MKKNPKFGSQKISSFVIKLYLLKFLGVKMANSANILKIVKKDPFLRFQMRAKEDFNRHQFFFHK